MDNITRNITDNSINFVQQQIKLKNSSKPYFADKNLVVNSVTDMDVFPYPRFYRGKYYDTDPNVMEREAGFRERHQNSYMPIVQEQEKIVPNVCFQPACSTIYPCIKQNKAIQEQEERNKILNAQICYNRSI